MHASSHWNYIRHLTSCYLPWPSLNCGSKKPLDDVDGGHVSQSQVDHAISTIY